MYDNDADEIVDEIVDEIDRLIAWHTPVAHLAEWVPSAAATHPVAIQQTAMAGGRR